MIQIGPKMVTRETSDANDGDRDGGSDAAMSGLVLQWCGHVKCDDSRVSGP